MHPTRRQVRLAFQFISPLLVPLHLPIAQLRDRLPIQAIRETHIPALQTLPKVKPRLRIKVHKVVSITRRSPAVELSEPPITALPGRLHNRNTHAAHIAPAVPRLHPMLPAQRHHPVTASHRVPLPILVHNAQRIPAAHHQHRLVTTRGPVHRRELVPEPLSRPVHQRLLHIPARNHVAILAGRELAHNHAAVNRVPLIIRTVNALGSRYALRWNMRAHPRVHLDRVPCRPVLVERPEKRPRIQPRRARHDAHRRRAAVQRIINRLRHTLRLVNHNHQRSPRGHILMVALRATWLLSRKRLYEPALRRRNLRVIELPPQQGRKQMLMHPQRRPKLILQLHPAAASHRAAPLRKRIQPPQQQDHINRRCFAAAVRRHHSNLRTPVPARLNSLHLPRVQHQPQVAIRKRRRAQLTLWNQPLHHTPLQVAE